MCIQSLISLMPLKADGWICAKGCVVSDSVTGISISGDEVERSLLKDNLSEFSRFTHCQRINLNGRILGSLFQISGHGSLTVLKLAGTSVDGDIVMLKQLSHLTELSLNSCNLVTGKLETLVQACPKLKILDLYGCLRLDGPLEPLARLTFLKELKLADSTFTGTLDFCSSLCDLETIHLARMSLLTGTADSLVSRKKLKSLHFNLTIIKGSLDFLSALALENLELWDPWHMSLELSSIQNMTSLKKFMTNAMYQLKGSTQHLSALDKLETLHI